MASAERTLQLHGLRTAAQPLPQHQGLQSPLSLGRVSSSFLILPVLDPWAACCAGCGGAHTAGGLEPRRQPREADLPLQEVFAHRLQHATRHPVRWLRLRLRCCRQRRRRCPGDGGLVMQAHTMRTGSQFVVPENSVFKLLAGNEAEQSDWSDNGVVVPLRPG